MVSALEERGPDCVQARIDQFHDHLELFHFVSFLIFAFNAWSGAAEGVATVLVRKRGRLGRPAAVGRSLGWSCATLSSAPGLLRLSRLGKQVYSACHAWTRSLVSYNASLTPATHRFLTSRTPPLLTPART